MIKEAIGIAATIDEARRIATQNLNAPIDADVKVEIVSMPKKKVLGLFGGANAQVKAFYDDGVEEPKKAPEKKVEPKKAEAKKENKRIIAIGTTSTRVLETVMNKYGEFKECHEESDIFIYPGYEFKAITSLITNFHLPKSTLIMLVSAFSKKEYVLNAYQEAIKNNYRFFSFGDSMFIS